LVGLSTGGMRKASTNGSNPLIAEGVALELP
jgi:hypothetical protein